jgi:phosphoribosylanthranilate isomerase
MKIKICGLGNLEDALLAIELGADMLGFNFYPPSPRYIDPKTCAGLITAIRDHGYQATYVGVFVNESVETIETILNDCDLDFAQLSGDEPPLHLQILGERAFKGLRPAGIKEFYDCERLFPRREFEPGWLIDTHHSGKFGGTGVKGDWDLAKVIAQRASILLAGGLNAGNVTEAMRKVNPWGVDVASGVESAPGRKDVVKMGAFIRAVREFDSAISTGD